MATIRGRVLDKLATAARVRCLMNRAKSIVDDAREGTTPALRRYANRYQSIAAKSKSKFRGFRKERRVAAKSKSKFRGFRKERREWDMQMPDGSFVHCSAWFRTKAA